MNELTSQRDKLEQKEAKICEVIHSLNKKDKFIDSINSVQQVLMKDHDIEAKQRDIRRVMVKQLGMSYRKITSIAIYANSNRNLVCRQ